VVAMSKWALVARVGAAEIMIRQNIHGSKCIVVTWCVVACSKFVVVTQCIVVGGKCCVTLYIVVGSELLLVIVGTK